MHREDIQCSGILFQDDQPDQNDARICICIRADYGPIQASQVIVWIV